MLRPVNRAFWSGKGDISFNQYLKCEKIFMEDELERVIQILTSTHVIAVVGASTNPDKSACTVPQYLQEVGYRVIPVNPNAAGETILDEEVYAQLTDVPDEIDMVQIFRPSEEVPEIVDVAIGIGAKYIWMQSGIEHAAAAARAESAGLLVVMDTCARVCHRMLVGQGLITIEG
jgi:predicted CoA-binding protein